MLRRLRLLPVAIFAAVLLLSVKAGSFFDDLESVLESVTVKRSYAQSASTEAAPAAVAGEPAGPAEQSEPAPLAPSEASAPAAEEAPVAAEEAPAAAAAETNPEPGAAPAASEETAEPERLASVQSDFDPLGLTSTEIALLQDLAARRAELDARAADLDLREKTLMAVEQQVTVKVDELKRIEVTVQDLLGRFADAQSARIESLVKIYQNMKPKDAARIFMELDTYVLLDVVERMRESKVAPILALMDPVRAKEITVELALRQNLPETASSAATPPASSGAP